MAPTKPFAAGMLIAAGIAVLGLQYPAAPTTLIESRGAFTWLLLTGRRGARAADRRGAGDAGLEAVADARLGPALVDGNIAQGELVKLVRCQIRAYGRR